MAATDAASDSPAFEVKSYETALCIIPPKHLWGSIDRLRVLYDKAYEKWPPHVNLVYPFVDVASLEQASKVIISSLQSSQPSEEERSISVRLASTGVFQHRHDNTIFICDDDKARARALRNLRGKIISALGNKPTQFRMHMTVGQSEDVNEAPHNFLLRKASLLPAVEWEVDTLYILVRERFQNEGKSSSQMKLWGTIDLNTLSLKGPLALAKPFYQDSRKIQAESEDEDLIADSESLVRRSLTYSSDNAKWVVEDGSIPTDAKVTVPESLTVANWNVLAEFEYPPSQERYPTLVKSLLERSAVADVLVLQEMTDDFLSFLLDNDSIRQAYPFVSHGPPDQEDLEPLPSHLNSIVLSKWGFSWQRVTLKRLHKGSLVLKFNEIGKSQDESFEPLILATVHLTRGLTDGAVATKKNELQSLLGYLSKTYPQNPWILAGDFNIATSSYTINAALEKKNISSQTVAYLNSVETMLAEHGLLDTWSVARIENASSMEYDAGFNNATEAFEGEQGATFDPTTNELAARLVGSGFNNRPQRFDRILVRGQGLLKAASFNMFGRLADSHPQPAPSEGGNGSSNEYSLPYGSDHWGVRCSLKVSSDDTTGAIGETQHLVVPVELKVAPDALSSTSELKDCLQSLRVIPTEEDVAARKHAFDLLKSALLEQDEAARNARVQVSFVVIPVGSYGLGVWTSASDIDCLCIGAISSRVFFSLAVQRLRKAAGRGIKILRRVYANSGTMLELEVEGFKMDLQYAASGLIAETWPRAMQLPANDPAFTMSTQTLSKLKPIRDLYYVKRSVPDLAAFRTAYQLIKSWAKQRGVYAARFGYLGGIHITILLSRVCKMLARDGRTVSVPSIICSFFHHYANFDWKHKMVFDPFFHKNLRYTRTAREPMAILGFHAPSLNTAHAASQHSLRTLSEEIKRADRLLSEPGMTWAKFLQTETWGAADSTGSSDFLKAYKSYIKIEAQFWGMSLAKGSQFVGWLESRCVMLLVDLNRRAPSIHARMWPARFVDEAASEEDHDYQGCYLIGLDKLENEDISKDDLKAALGALQGVLQKFEGQIRGDEKYFDAKSSWMSASVVRQAEVGGMQLDGREWGEYTLGDDESDMDEDEEEGELTTSDEGGSGNDEGSKSKSRKSKSTLAVRPAYTGKFRSSADVLSRLRWDPGMDSGDFVVGYLDRFLGAMERPLDQWKTEQTDEEFIPQHRILYFKRKSDDRVVWDREARKDEIFGSGVQSTE